MTSDTHAAGPVDQGEWLQTRPGERCLIRVAAAETNGAYSVVEILSQPGDSTPMHVHQNEDEHFLILEGTARIVRGDETFDAPAGTTVALPRHIPHAWGNATNSTLRMIATCWPGGVRSYIAVDSTRRRHRRESPRSEIRRPHVWGRRCSGDRRPSLVAARSGPSHRWINRPKWQKVARLRTCFQEYPCLWRAVCWRA